MKRKILTYFIYVIVAATLATMMMMAVISSRMFETQVVESMRYEAEALRALIEEGGEARLDEIGSDVRVTIIDAQGDVRYDNEADPAKMESHAQRPEVIAALETGVG